MNNYTCVVNNCVMDNIVLGKDISVVVAHDIYWFGILSIFLMGLILGFSLGFNFKFFLNNRGKKDLFHDEK